MTAVVEGIRAGGLKVKPAGTLNQPFFRVPAQVFSIDGTDLQLYSFDSAADAQKAAATVSSDGGSIGTNSMAWMAAPHFFLKGNLIAISIGGSAKTITGLQRIFGPQFAGR